MHENVITFIQDFPKELNLERYVDHELQFNKAFLDPLKAILDVIGWKSQKTVSLTDFLK